MIWNNFKKLIKSKLKIGLDKNQSLEKMSRPRITFPGLPQVTTRPDQEVQPVESTRQRELFGRKVSADIKDQSAPVYQAGTKVGERLVSRKDEREAQAKKITGQFNRRTVGLNVNTKHGPKSAALVGKLRSKFEEGDEEHQAKIAAHKEKRLAAIKEHNQKVDDWNKKTQEIRAKMQQASTPEEQNAVRDEYNKHWAAAPKFKAPRTPSKKAKKTSDLSPEQAALRGKSVSATIEHEGFHHIFDDIEHKYGKVAAINARKKILQQHNLDTLAEVGSFISTRLGYNPKSSHFSEEILAHSRDILVNPVKREAFKKFLGTEKADKHIKNLKQGHQRAYEAAKKLTLADIMPEQVTQRPQKLAASELAKAPTENEDTVKLYHITDKANFKLNPNYAPEDNAIAIQDRSGRKGIYTAPSVEEWVNGHGYARPFVAELHVPKSLLSDKSVGGRWGREKFIPAEHFDKVKVHRVIPIDAHARETYGSHGWFEGESKEEFDTGKPIATKGPYPFKGYQYGGKDAREMAPDEVKQIKQRFNRGYKARFGKSELAKAPIAYHGSTRAFEEHEKPKKDVKTSLNYGPGIYYAMDPEEASQYAEPQVTRVSAHVKAYHDITKEPSYKAYRDEIAQKFGLDSSVDTRHKNWEKFRDHMLQYEMQKVSEKLGLTPNVRRSDVQVKNAFDPYNKNHAMAVYRVLGHEPNQFRLKNEHKAGANLYHHIAHEIPKFDNMQWGERTWHLNRAIKKAGFDGIHDKKLGHIIAFSPKQIKPAYGSQKKTKKLATSEMEKGSFQRRNKFNPKDVDPNEQEAAYNWTTEDLGYLSEYEGGDEESPTPRMHRDALDRVQGPLRSRALQKLSSVTRIRRAPDGKREFLLHRGYGDNEPVTFDKDSITHLERTSWTPHYHIANKFSKKPGGQVVSAWVHEDNIASMPMMYGKLKSPKDAEYDDFGEAQLHDEGESKFSDEKEVIVDPHTSKLHDLKNDPLAPKDLRSITPSDLNLRITERGKKTGFFNRSSLSNTLDVARAGKLPQKLGAYRQDKDPTKMAASEKLKKALSPEEIRSQGYSFKILKPTSKEHLSGRGFAVRAYHNKKPIGHAVFEQIKDQEGYHSVYNSNLEETHRGKGLYQHMLKIGAEHVKSLGSKGLKSQGFQRSPDATRAWDKIATHAIDRPDVSRGDPQRRADYYLAASELDKAVRSPRKGHTIAQLQRLKEMGWHNPDTGTEMQPEESEEHLMRLMERKAARQTERKVKETKAKPSESPADWFEAPKAESRKIKKGAQGDWQKEGYSFKHYPPKSESDSLHSVTAHSADGTLIGRLRAEDLNDGTFQALDVRVHPEHRRKGLASAMYGLIEKKTGLRAVPDLEAQSPEGKALWSQKTRSFGKSEFVNKKTLKKAPVSLLHFSPKEGLKEIDPKFARTGADKTAKHHQTEHPHSFYYRKGTTLPPADAHVWSGATQYEIEIPDDARLYDIGSDPEKHIKQLHEFSKEKPVNPGLVTMDDIHGMLKELGYHGFYNSNHPQLSNVVGLYHSQPVKKEG